MMGNPTQRAGHTAIRRRFRHDALQRTAMELYLKGLTQQQIGDKIGVSQTQVHKLIRKTRELWRHERIEDYDAMVTEELARLRRVDAEAWAEWEKSKRKRKITRTERGMGKGGAGQPFARITDTEQQQCGDPRYLAILTRNSEIRADLLGLKKAPKANGLDPAEIIRRMAPVLAEGLREAGCGRGDAIAILTRLSAMFDLKPEDAVAIGPPVQAIEAGAGAEADEVVDVEAEPGESK